MFSLRQKLLVGFGGLLIIILIIGIKSIVQVTALGGAIDAILRENYRSVLACQEMNEALDRMDYGTALILLDDREEGVGAIHKHAPEFEKALDIELHNITIPGEEELIHHIQDAYLLYKKGVLKLEDRSFTSETLRKEYFAELKPLLNRIKDASDRIIAMNQKNMYQESQKAKIKAALARHEMYVLLILGAMVAVCYVFLIGKWILHPIKHLTQSVDEIRNGNLDLVVKSGSRDEIGHLSQAFNEMTASIRELRRTDADKVERMQQSTQQTFRSLPNIVALADMEGRIEIATETAENIFGLKRGVQVRQLHHKWIADLFREAVEGLPSGRESPPVIQHFINAEEHYFKPTAAPILNKWRQMTGVILILNDVTEHLEQEELKRAFLSTVSHQLKTPLTSVRMALHILLGEKVGPLTPKQEDLVIAAREDSDRLNGIIENLMDIGRIDSGRMEMNIQSVSPRDLITASSDTFRGAARDRGIELTAAVPENLPRVMADTGRIGHVFDNLISNALKYTPSGGKVTISAMEEKEFVRFSVSDTGKGIPAQYLSRIFDRFFRVPGQEKDPGTGLGLTIVREIIKDHQGNINVESTEGQGSTFSFTLPRSDQVMSMDSGKEDNSWLI
jgi:signal transduction histidine kinase/HAMP domain-containing protein